MRLSTISRQVFVAVTCFLLLIITACTLHAQVFGGNRASIRWRQIDRPDVRVIFPVGYDSAASRVAMLSERLAAQHRATIGPDLNKVDIVLQAENTQSNAYVGLAPYRSELYLTPPQNPFRLGANTWADQLAIHEFRHAQQYSNYNIGLSRIGNILGGQQGRAVANALAVPDWFWEGDAIWYETELTRQGRGRLPYFFNAYKSLTALPKSYNWMKLRNGSLKHFVPNHYDLGYLLVSQGRQRFGDTVWRDVTRDAAAYRSLVWPMQKAFQKHTGVTYSDFTREALDSYRNEWKQEGWQEPGWMTSVSDRYVQDYQYPYPTDDGGFIVLKSGYRQIPVFVERQPDGRERRIGVRDIGVDDYFGYAGGRIVYSAWQPDPRWGNRDFSVIRVMDAATGKVETVTRRTRYFSPDITADGERIVAVEVRPALPAQLHVVDRAGEVTHRFSADSSFFFSHPKWLQDGEHVVVAVRTPSGDMGWLHWTPATGEHTWLLEPGERIVGFPVVQGNRMVYTETVGGRDALVVMDLQTRDRKLASEYPTGIYQGFVRGDSVIGAYFTAYGHRLGATSLKQGAIREGLPKLYAGKADQGIADLTSLPTRPYASQPYRRTFRLFNFHSWQPEFNEPDYTFRLLGENILASLGSEIFYTYNVNERFHRTGLRLVGGGLYVQPVLDASQTWGRQVRLNADTVLTYNESQLGLGLQLPLHLSFGRYFRRLTLSGAVRSEWVNWTGQAKERFVDRQFPWWNARMVYSAQIQRAVQHIFPRFAHTVLLDFRQTMGREVDAWQGLASAGLFLPGLHVNHNLVITAAYQARDTLLQYLFTNSFPFARGYNVVNFPRMWRVGFNYHFPVAYPDAGFGNLLYFRRLRANTFYDYMEGKSLRTGRVFPLSTVGGELYFDMKFWNIQTATIGVRYSHLLNDNLVAPFRKGRWELILPLDLFSR